MPVTLTPRQAQTQVARLAQVRPDLADRFVKARTRWLGDPRLLALGYPIVVEGYRAKAVQAAYYAQGRQPLAVLNKLRVAAGLETFPKYSQEAATIITHKLPGTSKHECVPSEAIDCGFVQASGEVTQPAATLLLFAKLMCYQAPEITWGADWDHDGRTDDEKFKDWPHFEIR